MRPCFKNISPLGEAPLAYPVLEFFRLAGICKTKGYGEIRSGRLWVVKCGRRTLVTRKAAHEYIALLEREAGHGDLGLSNEVGREP
jgi:hypothetical protein